MTVTDFLVVAAIALVVGAAVFYIVRAKRAGQKCFGCPYSAECAAKKNGTCHKT